MQIILEDVIERIKTLINGESIYSFAKKLNISQQTVDCYVNGKRKPSLDFIYRVCSICNVSSDWLLGLSPTGGIHTVNAGSGAAVNIGSGSATAGGDCSKCRLMQAHVRQITGRA